MSYAELLRDLIKHTNETDGAGASSVDAEFMCRSLLHQDTVLSALAIAAAVEDFDRNYPEDEIYHTTGEIRRGIELRAAELRKGAK